MKIARTKAFAIPLIVTGVLAFSAVSFAGSLVTNGNFNPSGPSTVYGGGTVNWTGGQYGYDPTNIGGWTFAGGAGVQQNGSAWGFSPAPGSAGQTAFLQSYKGNNNNVPNGNLTSSISQNVSGLTDGQQYAVTFYLEQRPGYGANPVTITIDGVTFTVTPPNNDKWTEYTEDFTYDGGSDTLMFSVTGPGSGTYDNDTGLADAELYATPEPGTLLLLGTGLLGLAFLAFRKAKSSGLVLHS